MISTVFATIATFFGVGGAQPTAAPVRAAAVTGPGRLLAYPLVYRDTAGFIARAQYVVFFRSAGPFAGRDSVGGTVPGELSVDDSSDNHDGFAGAISSGHPSGKCYWWVLSSAPKLDRVHVGGRVSVEFKLHGTSAQRRTVRLRAIPKGLTSSNWTAKGRVAGDLRSIGCRGRSFGPGGG